MSCLVQANSDWSEATDYTSKSFQLPVRLGLLITLELTILGYEDV